MNEQTDATRTAGQGAPAAADAHKPCAALKPPRPIFRFLRGYAFDPSLSLSLDTAAINEVTFAVEWEDLKPGPVGEYLEVIDYDPASSCMYPPVNLNHPHILAQSGIAPTEGNPQFHQQMVYSVAMTTISNFEQALGRKVLWAPCMDPAHHSDQDPVYVPRLRIYPHALRQANAFYSSRKKALLFGYFPAAPANPGLHLPGGTVFTCLDQTIIAHETSHALLDGMHPHLIIPTNPDVLAFHEAFADLVALFQHFSLPGILRDQIARTRGDLASQHLLGQVAQQLGAASGRYGALRDAIGKVNETTGRWEPLKPDPQALAQATDTYERGAILVAAVFDAFLTIYKSRVADLLRIATNGTGVLPPGALHPDLVNRMADEAAKSAGHVLQICIRALDYLPPFDITFGEYLRALITADGDAVPYDDRSYRIAFIDAFRRRGIYPRHVRSLAEGALRWNETNDESEGLKHKFAQLGRELLQSFLQPRPEQPRPEQPQPGGKQADARLWNAKDRELIFHESQRLRKELKAKLKALFATAKDDAEQHTITGLLFTAEYTKQAFGEDLLRTFTLEDGRPDFAVHSLRLAERVTPKGGLLRQFIIGIFQTRTLGDTVPFHGGCTLIIDADDYDLRFAIRKGVTSPTRLDREQRRRASQAEHSPQADPAALQEPFALLHSSY